MIGPLTLPDWLPWWGAVAILVPGVLFLLAFVLMPFNVFGVKSRLDIIEARLDEIQGEIRALSLRLPDPGRIPIPPARPDFGEAEEAGLVADRRRPGGRAPAARAEPRLDWPR